MIGGTRSIESLDRVADVPAVDGRMGIVFVLVDSRGVLLYGLLRMCCSLTDAIILVYCSLDGSTLQAGPCMCEGD